MIINRGNLSALFTSWNGLFGKGLTQNPALSSEFKRFAEVTKSITAANFYSWMDAFPRIRKWVGDRHIKDLTKNKYELFNDKFEGTVSVTADEIDDDLYTNVDMQFSGLGTRAAQFPNELVYGVVKDGLTAKCYDGRPFFDTAHPLVNSSGTTTTFSNLQAGAGNPWYLLCTKQGMKPFVYQERQAPTLTKMFSLDDEAVFMRDEFRSGTKIRAAAGYTLPQLAFCSRQPLTQANFEAAYLAMQQVADSEGVPLGFRPDLLLVGASNRALAVQIIKSDLIPYAAAVTGSGTTSVGGNSNPNKDIVELIDTPYLP